MKVIFLVIFICFSLVAVVIGQKEDEKKEDRSLRLFIRTNKQTVCFGKPIRFSSRLSNVGKDTIIIDTKRIGYRTSYSWFNSKPKFEGGYSGSIGHSPGEKPNFVVLRPKESFAEESWMVIEDKKFSKRQKFKIQIAYGQFSEARFENSNVWRGVIDSNEMDIFLKKC